MGPSIISISISIISIISIRLVFCSFFFLISFATWNPVHRLSLMESDYHDISAHDRSQCCYYWTFFFWKFIEIRLIFNFLKLFTLKSAVLNLIGDACFSNFFLLVSTMSSTTAVLYWVFSVRLIEYFSEDLGGYLLENLNRKAEVVDGDKRCRLRSFKDKNWKIKTRDREEVKEKKFDKAMISAVETEICEQKGFRKDRTATIILESVTPRVTGGPMVEKDRLETGLLPCGVLPVRKNLQNSVTNKTNEKEVSMNDSMLNVEQETSEEGDKEEYKAKDATSADTNEIDDTSRDSKSMFERGTDEILSADSNEDIFDTNNFLEACFQGSSPLTAHGLP